MRIQDVVCRPIPDFTQARRSKSGYRAYPLAIDMARNGEPLVDIADYGIAGQSYYSRPNSASVDPLPGVQTTVLVRQQVAERLATINYHLQQSKEVAALLGGQAELYVDEGLRSLGVQAYLYDEAFPALIRAQNPKLDQAAVLARRDEVIAWPPDSEESPSPHATGAAVDIKLRYCQSSLSYVPHSEVMMQLAGTHESIVANPDYYEHVVPKSKAERDVQRNRRVFYWVMRGALIGEDSGLVVNPTEWWHWSYGDQMWAKLTNAPQAFYGTAPDSKS